MCCRRLAGIRKRQQWQEHITDKRIRHGLHLRSIDYYIERRALRWIGHISRMDENRLPRMLFFSWVPGSKRSRGRPQKHFGHHVKNTLIAMVDSLDNCDARKFRPRRGETPSWRASKDIAEAFYRCASWMNVAQDKAEWKRLSQIYLDKIHIP